MEKEKDRDMLKRDLVKFQKYLSYHHRWYGEDIEESLREVREGETANTEEEVMRSFKRQKELKEKIDSIKQLLCT